MIFAKAATIYSNDLYLSSNIHDNLLKYIINSTAYAIHFNIYG